MKRQLLAAAALGTLLGVASTALATPAKPPAYPCWEIECELQPPPPPAPPPPAPPPPPPPPPPEPPPPPPSPPGLPQADWSAAGGLALVDHGEEHSPYQSVGRCWWATWKVWKGLWPLSRELFQQTRWCSNGRQAIASFNSTAWVNTGWACSTNWGPQTWHSGGGTGEWTVEMTSRAGYSCGPLYELGFLTDYLDLRITYNAIGRSYAG